MKLRCPSKTFLVGEYAVLSGGPAILLATEPYFEWENNSFIDPYQGKGGFGASGAKFVFNAYHEGLTDVYDAIKKFHSSHQSGSGADIVCQFTGGVTFYHPQQKKIEKLSWPFSDLYVVLIHTGFKLLTHEHLEKLNLELHDFSDLEKTVLTSYQTIIHPNQQLFIQSINEYYEHLQAQHLVCKNTISLVNKIKQQPDSLAVKGCGALGADVILTIIHQKNKTYFLNWALQEKLQVIYCGNQFAEGVKKIL